MTLITTYTAEERERRENLRMQCRADRHDMERQPEPPGWVRPHSQHWLGARKIMHKRCKVCGVWRHIAYTHRFTFLTAYYDNRPEGYLQEPGEGRVPREDVIRWEFEQVEKMEAKSKSKRRLRSVG